jgi:hypothetical protein
MKKSILFLSIIFISSIIIAQTDIAAARALSMGTTVTVSGVAVSDEDDFSSPIIYIQDASAGIALYDFDMVDSFNIARGDSITVTGELADFQDLMEVTNVTSFTNHGQTNMPAPKSISVSGLNETNESMLVQIMHNNTDSTGVYDDYKNYMFESSADSFVVRIQGGCNIEGDSILSHYHMITGIVGEYQTVFQLIPRDSLDLSTSMVSIRDNEINTKADIKTFYDKNSKSLKVINRSNQDWSWVMVDLTGKLIQRNTIAAQNSMNLDMASYINGVYFLSLNDGKNRKTEKLILH